jgi:peroxiredoxin
VPLRISYLIDPQGVIAKAYEVTDPAGHAAGVVADLQTLRSTIRDV